MGHGPRIEVLGFQVCTKSQWSSGTANRAQTGDLASTSDFLCRPGTVSRLPCWWPGLSVRTAKESQRHWSAIISFSLIVPVFLVKLWLTAYVYFGGPKWKQFRGNLFYLFMFGCAGSGCCCSGLSLIEKSRGYSGCGVPTSHLWLLLLRSTGSRALGLQQLWHVGPVILTSGIRAQAQQVVSAWVSCCTACGICLDRDRTRVSCVAGR